MKVFAIIAAAGSGSRFSAAKTTGKQESIVLSPKQFVSLKGKPVILYSLLAFQKSSLINEIYVSSIPGYFDFIHNLSIKNQISKLTTLVEGGKTRFESVRNAFFQIDGKANDLVLVHDAARPNVDIKMIDTLISAALKYGEVIPGIKISETVKKEKKRIITGTIDRNNLWLIQTPQVFRYKILKKAYEKAGRRNDFTDESSVVEHTGFKVRVIEGNKYNTKITSPEDLKVLKKLL
jgi:2-C-methyl-D-erythritol 4-phosphate cytidylyltransferase